MKKCGGRGNGVRKYNELCAAQAVTSVVCPMYQREMAVLVLGNSSLTVQSLADAALCVSFEAVL